MFLQMAFQINKNYIDDEILPIFLDDVNECRCCLELFPPDEIVMCTGANQKYLHITCHSCLRDYLLTIMDQKTSMGCMMSIRGCKGRYHDTDVQKALSEEEYRKYIDCCNVEETVQLANIIDNYHMCPFCSKYGIIIDGVDRLTIKQYNINCPRCKKDWCIKCRTDSHIPEPCGKLQTADANAVRTMIDKIVDDAAIHKCPKCFLEYNKEDGCNMITCSSCKACSCYICGILIEPKNSTYYWHFSSSISTQDNTMMCPLYNVDGVRTDTTITKSNIEYNIKKIKNALTSIMELNADNKEILLAICNDIRQRGYNMHELCSSSTKLLHLCNITVAVNDKPNSIDITPKSIGIQPQVDPLTETHTNPPMPPHLLPEHQPYPPHPQYEAVQKIRNQIIQERNRQCDEEIENQLLLYEKRNEQECSLM